MNTIKCAVLGGTGIVGQRFIKLLDQHPFFELSCITASKKNQGKAYKKAVHWNIEGDIPTNAANLTIDKTDWKLFQQKDITVVFSAIPPDVAAPIETSLANHGFAVFSNSRAHRYDASVPILIPEVNPDHIDIITHQKNKQNGFIITNANCTTTGLVLALKPLLAFNIKNVIVSTYQALSGAGYPGVSALDITGNVVPFIKGEEEKIQIETQKILGDYRNPHIVPQQFPVIASCARVPVRDGHLESVVIEFEHPLSLKQIKQAFQQIKPVKNLPTSPEQIIIIREEADRPQQRIDANAGTPQQASGMSVSIGRFKQYKNHLRFFLVVHNTLRGAAGNSVLNAEFAYQKGYLKPKEEDNNS